MTTTRRVAAVVVHYGDHQRTIRAVLGHWDLKVFARIIVVANDLSDRPAELTDDICTWVIPSRNLGFGGDVSSVRRCAPLTFTPSSTHM